MTNRNEWWTLMRRYERPLGAVLVLVLSSAMFLYQLGAKDIWDRPEARAVVSARHIVERSQFLVPQLFDRPFIDNRPPGYYWLTAFSFLLSGEDGDAEARLPSAITAVITVLSLYGLGCRMGGAAVGLWASIILLGTAKFVWQGRVAEQDTPLAMWTCLAFWVLWNWCASSGAGSRSASRRLAQASLLHVLIGLAAMVKGPAIILTFVLPAGVYLVMSGRHRRIDWTMLLVASPIALVLSLWWYVYVWFALPQEHAQLIGRFLNQGNLHVRSWYYYIAQMPAMLGPVTVLLPLPWLHWRDADREGRTGAAGFTLAWFLGSVAILSLLPSKQTHYLVPAFPGFALALALALTEPRLRGHHVWAWFVGSIMIALLLVAAIRFVPFQAYGLDEADPLAGWEVVAVAVAAVAALGAMLYVRGVDRSFGAAWVCWLAAMLFLFGHVVPRMDVLQSARAFSREIEATIPGDAQIGVLSNNPAVIAYLDVPVVLLRDAHSAHAFLGASTAHFLLVKSNELEHALGEPEWQGTEIVLQQSRFLKGDVTAYLLRSRSVPGQ